MNSLKDTENSEPFQYYALLRDQGDVVWDEGLKAWIVTTHEAIRELLREDDVLVRQNIERNFQHKLVEAGERTAVDGGRKPGSLTGEEHRRLHQWWLRSFSPRVVERLRLTVVRPVTTAMIDRFASRGTAELVSELAEVVPPRVIAGVLGLPWDNDAWIASFKSQFDILQDFYNQTLSSDLPLARRADQANEELKRLLQPFIDERRGGSGEDMISLLLRDGPSVLANWNDDDVRTNLINMFFGGTETTTHVIANGLYMFMNRPGLADRVRSGGDAALSAFVEEALRLYGAVQYRSRIALKDFSLCGKSIRTGDRIATLQSAANRDPKRYPNPDEVNLTRPTGRDHLAFSFGPHVCVGAALARVELQEVFQQVLQRLPDLAPAPHSELPHFHGMMLRNFTPLHASFTSSIEANVNA